MLATLDDGMILRIHVAVVDLYIPIVEGDRERMDAHHLLSCRHHKTSRKRIAFCTTTSLPTRQYAYKPRAPMGYLATAPKTCGTSDLHSHAVHNEERAHVAVDRDLVRGRHRRRHRRPLVGGDAEDVPVAGRVEDRFGRVSADEAEGAVEVDGCCIHEALPTNLAGSACLSE